MKDQTSNVAPSSARNRQSRSRRDGFTKIAKVILLEIAPTSRPPNLIVRLVIHNSR